MAKQPEKKKIAIACEGGGSHTAFTAGVVSVLLAEENAQRFELVALSGTSGGAMCAALAWSALISGEGDRGAEAAKRLQAFWDDLKADDPFDAALNYWGLFTARLPVVAEISPYAYAPFAQREVTRALRDYAKLDDLPADATRTKPFLFVAATEILEGVTKDNSVFPGETITIDQVVASAAIPPVFRAIAIGEKRYWDGLFSHNPPIRVFTDIEPKERRPDEIWIVRINPQKRQTEPTTMPEIIDRRNELSGNLALDQERAFIEKINELIAGEADGSPEKPRKLLKYKHIEIREIALDEDKLEARRFRTDYVSKLDRSPDFIDALMEQGRNAGAVFLRQRFPGAGPGAETATTFTPPCAP
jgi:NTE family protein